MKLTKLSILAFLALILITTSCTSVVNKNEMVTPSFIETPSVMPTASLEQDPNFSVQCLELHPSTSQNTESRGNILLKDYYNKRSLFAIQLPRENSTPIIFGEGFLAPVISPNGKILAYLNVHDTDTPELVLVNSNGCVSFE